MFRQIFQFSNDGIMVFDPHSKEIVEVNDKALAMYGFSREEFLQKTIIDVSAEPEKTQKSIELTLLHHKHTIPVRYHKQKGGSVFPVEISGNCFDINGRQLICAIIRDMTNKMEQEKILQESEKRFRGIFDNTSNGVVVYKPNNKSCSDFVIVDFNKAAAEMEKLAREDVIGRSLLQVFPGVKEFGLFAVLKKVWRTGKPEVHSAGFYKDDRIIGWRENYMYKLASGEVITIYTDLSKTKKLEDQLRSSLILMEEKISERTRELITINQQLVKEIKEKENKEKQLGEINLAMKHLLKHSAHAKEEIEEIMFLNIKNLISPYLDILENNLSLKDEKTYVAIIKANLNEITSTFHKKLSSHFLSMTVREIQVADLVRYGKTNQEIAELLGVSNETIKFHRSNLRKKLGLSKTSTNLRTFLLNLQQGSFILP